MDKKINRDIGYLFGLKFFTYSIPLLLLPFLARTLGDNNFGIYSMAWGLGIWLSIIIEFGFILSGTREIAINMENHNNISKIISQVYSAKIALSFLVVIITVPSAYFIDQIRSNTSIILSIILIAVTQGFSATWFFQGIGKIGIGAVLDITGKIIFAISILIFVRQSNDFVIALYCYATGSTITALTGYFLICKSYGEIKINAKLAKQGISSHYKLFISRGIISFYTSINIIILGILSSPQQVAYFAAAEKIVKGTTSLIGPISQAIFPEIARLISLKDNKAGEILKQSALLIIGGSFLTTIILMTFSSEITYFLFGDSFMQSSMLIFLMSTTIPLIAIGNILGIQWMIPNKLDSDFNRLTIIAAIINVAIAIILIPQYEALGVVAAMIAAEFSIVSGCLYFFIRKNHAN